MKTKRFLIVLAIALLALMAVAPSVSAASSQVYTCGFSSLSGSIIAGNCNPGNAPQQVVEQGWDSCVQGALVYTTGGPYPADGSGTFTDTCTSAGTSAQVSPPPPEVPQVVKDLLVSGQLPYFDGQATWGLRDDGATLARYEVDSNGVHKAEYFCTSDLNVKYGYSDENGNVGNVAACPPLE